MDPTETVNSSPNITKFRDNTDFINIENKSTETQKEQDLSNGDIPKESVEKSENEWTDILSSGGIMKKILQEGNPETRPEKSDKCEINYKCMLEDETLVEEAQNFEINLGECDVIQGLDVAISLMNVNEKCLLKIESRLAFGQRGLLPKIPPNCTVLYEIELVKVSPADEIESLTITQRKELGNKKKERGNWWYGRGENNIAIQCYRRALDYLDEVESNLANPLNTSEPEMSDEELQNLLENRVSVYNNMAAAQIKMELYDVALNSLEVVLRCQPNNIKALFRKAKIYIAKNDLGKAMKCLQKANEIEPNNQDIQKQINFVTNMVKKQKVTERELAKRMLSSSSKNSPNSNTKTSNNRTKVRFWTFIGATVSVCIASIAAYRLKYA